MSIELIIKILAILVMAFVLPWIKAKIGDENLRKIVAAIEVAVKAAEQIFSEPGSGAMKKQWVLDFINSKFKINEDDAERLMEAFVYEMNKDKLQPILYETEMAETAE